MANEFGDCNCKKVEAANPDIEVIKSEINTIKSGIQISDYDVGLAATDLGCERYTISEGWNIWSAYLDFCLRKDSSNVYVSSTILLLQGLGDSGI